MDKNSEFRIALIGTGYIGQTHALAYNSVNRIFPETPLLVRDFIVDVSIDAASKAAKKFDFKRSSDNWRDAVNDDRIDIIAIAAPNFLHKEIAIAALNKGKHVYCEKPLSITLNDAQQMADVAAGASKSRTMVGYNYVCNPIIEFCRSLIEEGHIGRPYFFRGVNDEDYMADSGIPYSWRCERNQAGSGVLADLGTHLIHMAEFLLGDIVDVMGKTFIAHEFRQDVTTGKNAPVTNDDIASAIVSFSSGATGELSASRVAWGRKNRLAFEIHGDRGTIVYDQEKMNEIKVFERSNEGEISGFKTVLAGPEHPPYPNFVQAPGHQIGFNDLKTIEIRNFLLGLIGQLEIYPTFEDALKTEKIVDAILESSRQGRPIKVQ